MAERSNSFDREFKANSRSKAILSERDRSEEREEKTESVHHEIKFKIDSIELFADAESYESAETCEQICKWWEVERENRFKLNTFASPIKSRPKVNNLVLSSRNISIQDSL